jgi:hypothetical protein
MVVTGKDNFIANIVDEAKQVEEAKTSNGKRYVKTFGAEGPLVLENIAILVPGGGEGKMGILPFKDVAFGADCVTVPASAVTEIYFTPKDLATQVKAAVAGIALAK